MAGQCWTFWSYYRNLVAAVYNYSKFKRCTSYLCIFVYKNCIYIFCVLCSIKDFQSFNFIMQPCVVHQLKTLYLLVHLGSRGQTSFSSSKKPLFLLKERYRPSKSCYFTLWRAKEGIHHLLCHVMLPGAAGHYPVPLQEDLNCHSSHRALGLHAGSV